MIPRLGILDCRMMDLSADGPWLVIGPVHIRVTHVRNRSTVPTTRCLTECSNHGGQILRLTFHQNNGIKYQLHKRGRATFVNRSHNGHLF